MIACITVFVLAFLLAFLLVVVLRSTLTPLEKHHRSGPPDSKMHRFRDF